MNAENSLVLFSELHAKFTQNDTKNLNTKKVFLCHCLSAIYLNFHSFYFCLWWLVNEVDDDDDNDKNFMLSYIRIKSKLHTQQTKHHTSHSQISSEVGNWNFTSLLITFANILPLETTAVKLHCIPKQSSNIFYCFYRSKKVRKKLNIFFKENALLLFWNELLNEMCVFFSKRQTFFICKLIVRGKQFWSSFRQCNYTGLCYTKRQFELFSKKKKVKLTLIKRFWSKVFLD